MFTCKLGLVCYLVRTLPLGPVQEGICDPSKDHTMTLGWLVIAILPWQQLALGTRFLSVF